MRTHRVTRLLQPRTVVAGVLCSAGAFLAMLSVGATPARWAGVNQAASPSTNGNWTIVESPNSRPSVTDNFPLAVTCVSESDCWMVGYYNNVSAYQTLVQHWDGSSWSVINSPNTSATQHNILRSATCIAADDCWAVGSHYDGTFYKTLIQHWDGTAWSAVDSPNTSTTQYNYLLSVACVSSSECWAAGYYSDNSGIPQTLIQRWNGTSWNIVASPNTSSSQENVLTGIACVSSQCWTVGWSVNAAGMYQTLIQRWDGNAWAITNSPNTLLPQDNFLNAVACSSITDCWAVGYTSNALGTQTLTARWDGSSWSLVSSPNTSLTESNRLDAVGCKTASNCWAVGRSNDGNADRTLIQRWDGSSWTIAESPNPSPGGNNDLRSVSCASATRCWAAGSYHAGNVQQTLVSEFNGATWMVQEAPNINAARNNTLLGITCASASDCWTVASYFNGSVQQTLIEHWDGHSWEIIASPNSSDTENNILYDVTCSSASDCWAIGYHDNGSVFQTLILRWDGDAWSIVPSPSTSALQNNFLTDIHCVSSSLCWAVGYYDNDTAYQTLIERWDGNAWTIVSSPNNSATLQNRLHGVTCASANDCWAVGRYFDGLDIRTLIEHWDGNTWTIITSPNEADAHENILWSTACVSGSDCWAVGSSGRGDGTGQPMIQHWDGTSWSMANSPKPTLSQFNYNFLRNVTCTSATNCRAVGYYFTNGVNQTLIAQWNGVSWDIVPSPNTSNSESNYLFGLTCLSAFDCWAAGYHTDESGVFETMVQHFTAPIPLLKISSIARTAAGQVTVRGQTEPSQLIDIQTSTDLRVGFETIGSTMSDESGAFQFADDGAGGTKFYRAAYQ